MSVGTADSAAAPGGERLPLARLSALAERRCVYAVLDATDAPAVPAKAKELGDERALSLYRGTAKESWWAVAPYLMVVDRTLIEWIASTLWHDPWGIFVVSSAGLDSLYNHLRRFLAVWLPDRSVWLFRFYDPRVLRTFLATCLPWELRKLAGPALGFATSGQNDNEVLFWPVPKNEGAADEADRSGFQIRKEQLAAFEHEAEESFVQRLLKHLQETQREVLSAIPPEHAETWVRHGIARARAYGITWEQSVAAFVGLMFAVGTEFDLHPRIHSVLCDPSIPPDARMHELLSRITEAEWEAARLRQFVRAA